MDSPGLASQSPVGCTQYPGSATGPTRATLAGIAALLLTALAAVYWNAFQSPFVFDDRSGVFENTAIHNLSQSLSRAWTESRGLTELTFAFNYELHGLDVRGYHLVNDIIHFLAALTLFGVVRRTLLSERLRDRFGSAATGLAVAIALVWMIHPLQTQAVTYTVQRFESLMGLFFLLTLYCFRRGVDDQDRRWLVLSVLCFALGARSKEVMFMAPFVVLWYDRAFIATSWRELLARKTYYLGLLAVAVLFMGPAVLRVAHGLWSQAGPVASGVPSGAGSGQADPSVLLVQGMTPWSYLATQPGVILRYLRISLLPLGQCADYGWPIAQGTGQILPGALVVGVLLLATLWAIFRRPEWAFLGGWFFLILLPTSSIVPIQDVAVEHRMYLPLVAIVTLVVLGTYSVFSRFANARPHAWGYALATLAVVALGGLTLARNEVYRTNESFWRDVIFKEPGNVRGHSNLGLALHEANRAEDATHEYQTSLKLKPDYPYAHYNLGNAYVALKQPDKAIAAYQQAIHFWPSYAGAFNNLGFALASIDRNQDAREAFAQALKLKPDYAGAYLNLGLLEAKEGNLAAAQAAYQQAISLDPTSAEAHQNLALVLSREQKWREALEQFDLALSIRPDYAKAHQNAGVVLMQMGQLRGAVEQLREAVRLQPSDAVALRILGSAQAAGDQVDEARTSYLAALEIDPKDAAAEAGLAGLAVKAEKFDVALKHFQRSLELAPNNGDVQHELANLLMRMGRNAEADKEYAKAAELLPKSAAVRVNSARLAEKLNQPERAIELYQQALAIDASFAPAHYNLGYLLASQQRSQEAIDRFVTAIRLDPTYAEAHFALGNALARTGQLELALDRYREVLRLRPTFAPARQNAQQVMESLRSSAAKPSAEGTAGS